MLIKGLLSGRLYIKYLSYPLYLTIYMDESKAYQGRHRLAPFDTYLTYTYNP